MKDLRIKVDLQIIQGMKCIICHQDGKAESCESSKNKRNKKGFITYNPKHGINNMMKHMENEHAFDLAQYKLEIVEGCGDVYKMAKKWNIVPPSTIIAFFGFHKPYHKNDLNQEGFLKILFWWYQKDTCFDLL